MSSLWRYEWEDEWAAHRRKRRATHIFSAISLFLLLVLAIGWGCSTHQVSGTVESRTALRWTRLQEWRLGTTREWRRDVSQHPPRMPSALPDEVRSGRNVPRGEIPGMFDERNCRREIHHYRSDTSCTGTGENRRCSTTRTPVRYPKCDYSTYSWVLLEERSTRVTNWPDPNLPRSLNMERLEWKRFEPRRLNNLRREHFSDRYTYTAQYTPTSGCSGGTLSSSQGVTNYEEWLRIYRGQEVVVTVNNFGSVRQMSLDTSR